MFPVVVVVVQSLAALANAGLAVFASHLAKIDCGPPVILLSTAASIGSMLHILIITETLVGIRSSLDTHPFLIPLIVLPLVVFDLTAVLHVDRVYQFGAVAVTAAALFFAQLIYLIPFHHLILTSAAVLNFTAVLVLVGAAYQRNSADFLFRDRQAFAILTSVFVMLITSICLSIPNVAIIPMPLVSLILPVVSAISLSMIAVIVADIRQPQNVISVTTDGVLVDFADKSCDRRLKHSMKEGEPSESQQRESERCKSMSLPQHLYSEGYGSDQNEDEEEKPEVDEVNENELRAVITAVDKTLDHMKNAKVSGPGRLMPVEIALDSEI